MRLLNSLTGKPFKLTNTERACSQVVASFGRVSRIALANRLSAMIHSVDHFLTTHVGSLPRPEELIQIMYSKEEGKPVDRSLLAAQVRAAVAAVVANKASRHHC